MIIYSVAITLALDIQDEWMRWMESVHIPDVLRTGCFEEAKIYKVIDSAPDKPTYLIQYRCHSLDDYHRYRDHFAPALQKEHSNRFIGRFQAMRQILEEVTKDKRENL